ncbi:MAG: hypothetical protein AAFQ40_04490, partial [Cyanobacteria bacterium J06623_5]
FTVLSAYGWILHESGPHPKSSSPTLHDRKRLCWLNSSACTLLRRIWAQANRSPNSTAGTIPEVPGMPVCLRQMLTVGHIHTW